MIIVNGDTLSPEHEVVQDFLAIVQVFSARLDGLRFTKILIQEAVGKSMTLSNNNVLRVQRTAHRIRLHPTPEQVGYLKRACGTRRFIYNWGLAEWQHQYAAYKEEQSSLPEGQHSLKPPMLLPLNSTSMPSARSSSPGPMT